MTEPKDLVDPLTGLSSAWHFQVIYDFAYRLGDRGIPLSIVLLEPDGIVAFQNQSGGDAGKTAMADLGAGIRAVSRKVDILARTEPHRVSCLLIDCNQQGALIFADRILGGLEGFTAKCSLTLSVGIASYQPEMESKEGLLEEARRALAAAQAGGGNDIALAHDYRT